VLASEWHSISSLTLLLRTERKRVAALGEEMIGDVSQAYRVIMQNKIQSLKSNNNNDDSLDPQRECSTNAALQAHSNVLWNSKFN
jgi:hypothetical protein